MSAPQIYPPQQGYTSPQYPQQFAPQPGYAPPQYPQQFPTQQGYPVPQMAAPAAPLAQGSLDDFFSQPTTGGGKSLAFEQVGTRYIGIVTRPLGPGDVQQQTDTQQRPLFFKDGRPKFVMKVPLQMQPSATYPDGLATWFVKGQARDELVRAMSEAGAPAGPPESGAIIDITHTGTRPSGAGMNPAKLFQITYRRPDAAGAEQQQQYAPQQPAPAPQQFVSVQQPAQPQFVPQQPAPAQQQYAPQQTAQPQPVQQTAPQPAMSMPSDLSAEQQALLAKLTGG